MTTLNEKVAAMQSKPVVVVKYHALQEGFATFAPRALYNVVGGDVPALVDSTVTIESLFAQGYAVREDRRAAFNQGNGCQGYKNSVAHSSDSHSSDEIGGAL